VHRGDLVDKDKLAELEHLAEEARHVSRATS
jgi:hypothetical protein